MTVRIIHGDNLEAMYALGDEGIRFALAYLDPPFLTGKTHRMADGRIAFDDRWPTRAAYFDLLEERLEAAMDLLLPNGSLVLHLDSKVVHEAKTLCDAMWGRDRFASEIIWRYRRWPTKTSNFQRVHDTLLRYRKDMSVMPRWNQLYEPLSPKTVDQWGQRKQRAVIGAGARRVRSSSTDEPSPGAPLGDVWDIGIIGPSSHERTGFPTQKPEALIERLVLALTDPGDFVLDPYHGSGTTAAVCDRHDRSCIGIDDSEAAIEVARARLEKLRTPAREVGRARSASPRLGVTAPRGA